MMHSGLNYIYQRKIKYKKNNKIYNKSKNNKSKIDKIDKKIV